MELGSPLSQFDWTKSPWLNLQYFDLLTCLHCHHGGDLKLVIPSFFCSLYSYPFSLFTQTWEVLDWTIVVATTLSFCYQRLAASKQHSWFRNLLFVFILYVVIILDTSNLGWFCVFKTFVYSWFNFNKNYIIYSKNHCIFSIQARLIENN